MGAKPLPFSQIGIFPDLEGRGVWGICAAWASVGLAACATVMSYLAMNWLISVDLGHPRIDRSLVLSDAGSQDVGAVNLSGRGLLQSPMAVTLPPPLPRPLVSKEDVGLPVLTLQDLKPAEPTREEHFFMMRRPLAANEAHERYRIIPVEPIYPPQAVSLGIEGTCDVVFHVNALGEPYGVAARCTDPIFKQEAEHAVSKARFTPKIVRGQPVERRNVVYPIIFTFDE